MHVHVHVTCFWYLLWLLYNVKCLLWCLYIYVCIPVSLEVLLNTNLHLHCVRVGLDQELNCLLLMVVGLTLC